MGENRQTVRQTLAPRRRCSLGLLSFAHLERSERAVSVVDISDRGMGVLSDHPLEPGLVWFPAGIEDHRGGLLVWIRNEDGLCRAGIRFLPFGEKDEQFLQYWPPCDGQLRPCGELEEFISAWVGGGRKQA